MFSILCCQLRPRCAVSSVADPDPVGSGLKGYTNLKMKALKRYKNGLTTLALLVPASVNYLLISHTSIERLDWLWDLLLKIGTRGKTMIVNMPGTEKTIFYSV
jgi:hypothetical protein